MPKKMQKKKKNKTEPQVQETRPKDFLDLIAPAAVKFNTDHYICGSMYHCTLALRSYDVVWRAVLRQQFELEWIPGLDGTG